MRCAISNPIDLSGANPQATTMSRSQGLLQLETELPDRRSDKLLHAKTQGGYGRKELLLVRRAGKKGKTQRPFACLSDFRTRCSSLRLGFFAALRLRAEALRRTGA
jgi:hypothetical protein